MAKPIDLYQGGAPAAMSQMGAGLSQAGANIGQSLGQGYAAIGQAIGSIGQAAGQAYSGYQTAKASNDMMRGLATNPETAAMIGLDTPEKQKSWLDNFNKVIKEHGQYGASRVANPYLAALMQDAQMGREYANKIKLAQETAKAQFQYSPKAVRYSSFADNESLYPQGTQQSDPVTGGMDLNAPSQPGADQSLPLFGGTGIADQFNQYLTPKPFTVGK